MRYFNKIIERNAQNLSRIYYHQRMCSNYATIMLDIMQGLIYTTILFSYFLDKSLGFNFIIGNLS